MKTLNKPFHIHLPLPLPKKNRETVIAKGEKNMATFTWERRENSEEVKEEKKMRRLLS